MKSSLKLVVLSLSVIFGINAVAADNAPKGRIARAKSAVADKARAAKNRVASFSGAQVAKVRGGRLEQAYNVTSKYAGKAYSFAKSCVPSFVGSSAALYAYNNLDLSSVTSLASTKLASGKATLVSRRDYVAESKFGTFVTSTGSSIANNSYVQTMNANRGTTALFTVATVVLAKLAYDKYNARVAARSTTPAPKAVVTVSTVAA